MTNPQRNQSANQGHDERNRLAVSGPIRTCAGCGRTASRTELQRVASHQGAPPILDERKTAPGRGAWFCPHQACVERAWKRQAFARILKLKERPSDELKEQLLNCCED